MLPREIISKSWRPISGTLKLPPTQKLLCVLTSGKVLNNNNNSNTNTSKNNFSSSSFNLKFTSSSVPLLYRAAPCHSEEAVIQQTQQNIQSSTPVVPIFDMPTPLIEESSKPNQNEDKSAGTGNPQQHGKRKFNPWQKRNGPKQWNHSRNMSLEFERARRGPPTPTFPDGVPITRIRMFKHMQNATGANVKFRKHKVYDSLKRGR